MNSVILQIASKYVRGMFFIFAIFILVRGHNYPGGGFIGGLIASLLAIYDSFAFTWLKAQRTLKLHPHRLITIGLATALVSLAPSLLLNKPIMKGLWFEIPIPYLDKLKFGTPFLFDIGVFFTVWGVTLLLFFSLIPKGTWK